MDKLERLTPDEIMRFAASENVETAIKLLSILMDSPISLKQDTEFDTIHFIGVLDGEKRIVQKFMEAINAARGRDHETLLKLTQ